MWRIIEPLKGNEKSWCGHVLILNALSQAISDRWLKLIKITSFSASKLVNIIPINKGDWQISIYSNAYYTIIITTDI